MAAITSQFWQSAGARKTGNGQNRGMESGQSKHFLTLSQYNPFIDKAVPVGLPNFSFTIHGGEEI